MCVCVCVCVCDYMHVCGHVEINTSSFVDTWRALRTVCAVATVLGLGVSLEHVFQEWLFSYCYGSMHTVYDTASYSVCSGCLEVNNS